MASSNSLGRLASRSLSQVRQRSASTSAPQRTGPNVVLVDAVRTPFAVSQTAYKDLMAVDLQRAALFSELIPL